VTRVSSTSPTNHDRLKGDAMIGKAVVRPDGFIFEGDGTLLPNCSGKRFHVGMVLIVVGDKERDLEPFEYPLKWAT
jgi:hypothetical protein